ncbi:hypothetical protein PIB30_002579 [Stylosanthes scabra]|uniref:Disease resistance protein At3g14460 n=1 Tax=Stylosanthes scabra TaxID=79078 RepID=A0ABU6Z293_9FABA|nr:hypothetical protein [Stylosanthes scabra]
MAGALVGGAFLSGFINVLFDRFLTTDAVNLVLGKKLGPDLVERLKISLLAAEALLDDAEYKQLGNKSVREWLNSLKDAVYIADDLLDDVLTKAATQKEVRSFWSISFLNRDREIVDKMEGVVRKIEFLVKQKDFLGLQKITKDDSNFESQLSVIPIVGMGGVGKTTLAKWVYSAVEGFDLKAWVCISETFDIVEVTRTIIEEITRSTCIIRSLNSLQNELQEILSEKKFFIVLDDVWCDDANNWKQFKTPFQCGGKGSMILLTSRIKEVASVVQTCPSYFLNELSEDCCWLLFADNACFPESKGNPALEEIGRKIVQKCKGLPLAIETLGRLLRGKDDVKEWNVVLMSDMWEFSMKNSRIIPALLISYFQLPAYLKRCFVYCSLYPKDHRFYKDELVLLWMAEDLLRPPKRGESLEEVGSKCFEELVSRLFFKQDRYFVKMHDLLHDMAIFLAGDFYCRLEEHSKSKGVTNLTRHMSFKRLRNVISENFDSISEAKSLRTFLPVSWFSQCSFDCSASFHVLMELKYLRVLSFVMFTKLDALPDSIGALIHLRYLNLSGTHINRLPETLCNLHNLQTLILCACTRLTMLPSGMHNLVNLRCLDLRETCLEEMPGGISKLKQLRILDYFIVGRHEDNGIQELGGLSNLHGSLDIKKLENIVDVNKANCARMMDKKHLDNLWLEWSSGNDMVPNTQTEREILDSLQPHNGLKELIIKGYKGTLFPNWIGHCSYQNMTHVSLESSNNCCMLPSLGQLPSLKSLRIQGFDQLKSVGMEFYKNEGDRQSSHIAPFPLLETLEFDNMPSWEVWHVSDSETFLQLRNLQIRNCGMLKGDMLKQVFLRIVSSLADVSKVCKLQIWEVMSRQMLLNGDRLSIRGCKFVVEFAFNAMISINHLSCIREIEISGCSFAAPFPGNCLPKSLQKLVIMFCSKLEFPPQQQQQNSDLVELHIEYSCVSLASLSLDAFPKLKTLGISNCKNLKSVSMSEPPHTALQRLAIHECPRFVSISGEGLAAPNLTHLDVSFCSNLEALPRDMNTLFPSLLSLDIHGCPKIPRLPEDVLLPNLKQLTVGGCKSQLTGLSAMGNLEALTHLTIYDDTFESITKSYPEVGSLPHLPSLTTLCLYDFFSLETLECNQLSPLISLQELVIQDCSGLENMAGEKLPSSLLLFHVIRCPLLGEHCENKRQQIWPKIEHIPTIRVNSHKIV